MRCLGIALLLSACATQPDGPTVTLENRLRFQIGEGRPGTWLAAGTHDVRATETGLMLGDLEVGGTSFWHDESLEHEIAFMTGGTVVLLLPDGWGLRATAEDVVTSRGGMTWPALREQLDRPARQQLALASRPQAGLVIASVRPRGRTWRRKPVAPEILLITVRNAGPEWEAVPARRKLLTGDLLEPVVLREQLRLAPGKSRTWRVEARYPLVRGESSARIHIQLLRGKDTWNSLPITVSPPAELPDLVITGARAEPGRFVVTWRNVGKGPARFHARPTAEPQVQAVVYERYVRWPDGKGKCPTGYKRVNDRCVMDVFRGRYEHKNGRRTIDIAPGEERTTQISAKGLQAGTYRVTFMIDPDQHVPQADVSNDHLVVTIQFAP